MLDIPARAPASEQCDTCGYPADVALELPDGSFAAACWRDRIDLPAAGPGIRRLERRYGRWYSGRIAARQLVGTTVALECENCGAPGTVVYELTTDDGHWETVACRDCAPTSRNRSSRRHSGVVLTVHARRIDPSHPWV